MAIQHEQDFPPGHPARFDYNPASPEAIEWARLNIHPKGERDFAVGHIKAVDTAGNTNHVAVLAGVDPQRPDLEPFTGRTAEAAAALRAFSEAKGMAAHESPVLEPVIAPAPPPPGSIQPPPGQP